MERRIKEVGNVEKGMFKPLHRFSDPEIVILLKKITATNNFCSK